MDIKYYKIEDVASRTGLTKRALRYYEDIELIKPVRTESGYRLFTSEDVDLIKRVIDLRESLGFTLNEIKDVLYLEKKLKDIFQNETADIALIDHAENLIKGQIKIIEKREATMQRVKHKYLEVLSKLSQVKSKED